MTMPDTSTPQPPPAPSQAQTQTSSQSQPRPTAREQVREIKDQAVGQARDTFRDARDRVAASLGDSKTRMADQMGGMAEAFRHASERFRSDDQARIAGLADTAAAQVDQLASYLRNHDGDAILNDVDRIARRQPALVIGSAFALGLLAARFFKSSGRHDQMAGPHQRQTAGSGDGGFYGD